MSRAISETQGYLNDTLTAPSEIDRIISTAYVHARPVYLMLPTDMVLKKVSSIGLLSIQSIDSRRKSREGVRFELGS